MEREGLVCGMSVDMDVRSRLLIRFGVVYWRWHSGAGLIDTVLLPVETEIW